MTIQSGASIVATSSVLSQGIPSADGLTPEGLLFYLQSRLGGLDAEINEAFAKQQQSQKLRSALLDIQRITAGIGPEGGDLTDAQVKELGAAIQRLGTVDPTMAQNLMKDFANGGLYTPGSNPDGSEDAWKTHYDAAMASSLRESVGARLKQLESSANLDMIQLQSLMSARQQAIAMCTNLEAKCEEGPEAIVANFR